MSADNWFRDLRHALRQLARSPGFTAVAVLTLSIGIGANTAIFGVVNELLLRSPAHVADSERIVSIWTSDFSGPPYGTSSYPDYQVFREQRDVMADVRSVRLASMRSETAFATFPQRVAATLLGACAALALLLAAVGLYGVVAYAVSQRTREIGIRMALGAGRRAVVRMVLAGSMKVVVLGLAVGWVLALIAGRAVESFLGDVSPADPIALVAGPLVMIACALVASWLPAPARSAHRSDAGPTRGIEERCACMTQTFRRRPCPPQRSSLYFLASCLSSGCCQASSRSSAVMSVAS
jgi:hypothetical protein